MNRLPRLQVGIIVTPVVGPDPILAGEVARPLRPEVRAAPGPSPGEPFALTGAPARPRRPPER